VPVATAVVYAITRAGSHGPARLQDGALVQLQEGLLRPSVWLCGRFRGDVRAVLEDGLIGLIRVRPDRGIDADHHLVPLARRAGIDSMVKSRLREQSQHVRLLLRHGRSIRGWIGRTGGCLLTPPRWYSVSRAAASARRSRAPTSGVSRPLRTTTPSSSWCTCETSPRSAGFQVRASEDLALAEESEIEALT